MVATPYFHEIVKIYGEQELKSVITSRAALTVVRKMSLSDSHYYRYATANSEIGVMARYTRFNAKQDIIIALEIGPLGGLCLVSRSLDLRVQYPT